MDYFSILPKDIVILNLDGKVIEGTRKPSVEKDLHRIFYLKRDDICSVIHTHSMYSCILASLNWELPAVNYYIAIAGGKNVRCAEYESFGTWKLAEVVFEATKNRNASFLANHGLITCSNNIFSAFTLAEEVERMSEIYYKTKAVGEPKILSDGEVNIMLEKFKSYG